MRDLDLEFIIAWLGTAGLSGTVAYLWLVNLQPSLPIVPITLFLMAAGCIFAAGRRYQDHLRDIEERRYRITRRAGR
jgi:hypothetical protein